MLQVAEFTHGGDLIHAKRPAGNHARGKSRRKIGEKFAAIVVDAPARANHDLVVEHFRAPGHAEARRETPLAAGESGIAHAFGGKVRIVSGNDEAVRSDRVRGAS